MAVLITGATTGIGYELSKLFAHDGHHLVLVARNKELLLQRQKELSTDYGVDIKIFELDLSIDSTPFDLYEAIKDENIQIDFLINNAGFGLAGNFSETNLDTELNMIRLNEIALIVLTKLYLKEMLKRNSGRIMNVVSTAAFFSGPLMAIYYATKAHVLSFTTAIAKEIKGTHVSISSLCPGPTITEFQKRAGIRLPKILKKKMLSAEKVAQIGYNGFMGGKTIIIPGFFNKMSVCIGKHLPIKLTSSIIKNYHGLTKNEKSK
jgi:short-subunit dehydrogenase